MDHIAAKPSASCSDYAHLDSEDFRKKHLQPDGKLHLTIYIEGIHCANCMFRIESLANSIGSLESLRVHMGDHTAQAIVENQGSMAKVVQAIRDLGFIPHPVLDEQKKGSQLNRENRTLLMRLGIAGAMTANIMLLSISIYGGAEGELALSFHWISLALFLPVLIYSAQPFFLNTWTALKNRRPSIDLPIALALVLGGGLSTWHLMTKQGHIYFDSLSALVFLLLSSRYLLARIQQKYLSPTFTQPYLESQKVWLLEGNEKRLVPAGSLQIGDQVQLEQGEKLPVDGRLVDEQAFLNNAVITGESHPQKMTRGESCFAGSVCSSRLLTMEVTATGESTRLGQILHKMESEFFNRTPLVALADKAAQIFTVSVLVLGFVFLALYSVIDLSEGANRALALIVLACPCALAFATPLTQSLALQTALRRGFLIKKAESLEKLAKAKELVFDKTGTLTYGQFELRHWSPQKPEAKILEAIYALESQSDHPIAKAFTQELTPYRNSQLQPTEVNEILGWGIEGKVDGQTLRLGRSQTELESMDSDSSILTTSVDVWWQDQKIATAQFGDQLRKDALETLQALKAMGLELHVLTGDSPQPARLAARKLGLEPDQVHSQQSPEAKNEFVKRRLHAAMIGDGANDAVAMAGAFVSLAVKGSMEASMKAADIYLSLDGLKPLLEVSLIARQSMKVIKRNLTLSIVYNLICGTLALMGYINPLVAAVLMPISSVLVLSSSLIGAKGYRPLQTPSSTQEGNASQMWLQTSQSGVSS